MKGEIDLKPPPTLEGEKLVEWNLEKGREIALGRGELPKVLPALPSNHFLRRESDSFWMFTISPF